MKVWEFGKEDNAQVLERYALSMERIEDIRKERTVEEPYRHFFVQMAEFSCLLKAFMEKLQSGELEKAELSVLQDWNKRLYQDILPENYGKSYGNPAYAAAQLGLEMGQLLSFLYAEIRCNITWAYEGRLLPITAANEALIEIYNLFEEGLPRAQEVRDVLYWYVSDYADQTVSHWIKDRLNSEIGRAHV